MDDKHGHQQQYVELLQYVLKSNAYNESNIVQLLYQDQGMIMLFR